MDGVGQARERGEAAAGSRAERKPPASASAERAATGGRGEFWRPVLNGRVSDGSAVAEASASPASPVPDRLDRPRDVEERPACPICSTLFVIGSRYCFVCGALRQTERHQPMLPVVRDRNGVRSSSGRRPLPVVSRIALAFACALVAWSAYVGGAGDVGTPAWQVAAWRIESLLGAVCALLVSLLFKN